MGSALAQAALDGVYDSELGLPGRYISQPDNPGGGVITDIRVLPDAGDGAYEAFGLDVTAARLLVQVRRSEIPTARRKDQLIYPYPGGPTYQVKGDPRLHDIEKLEWLLELEPL